MVNVTKIIVFYAAEQATHNGQGHPVRNHGT